jgi:hypothetical protein
MTKKRTKMVLSFFLSLLGMISDELAKTRRGWKKARDGAFKRN